MFFLNVYVAKLAVYKYMNLHQMCYVGIILLIISFVYILIH